MNDDVLNGGLFVGGRLRTSGGGGTVPHVNPATGKAQADVVLADANDVDDAVAAARAAFPAWRDMRPEERRRLLTRLADAIRSNSERFVRIAALESATAVSVGVHTVTGSADWFEHSASWADKLAGEVVPIDRANAFDYVTLEPVGVVGGILTWNGPLFGAGMSIGPALAAGCTVVLKPSELAPFAAVELGRIALEAGLPPGVLNVVPGLAEAGSALVNHPGVDKITFTGGPAAGRAIAAACGQRLAPVVLELGGKSANIVFDDANLGKAVRSALNIIIASGQACTVPSRLLVHEAIYDSFVETVCGALGQIRVGDPLDPNTVMGPVISSAACDRILGVIERAGRDARLLTGGQRLGGELADGFFLAPTAFGEVSSQSELFRDEVFGPVVAVSRFADEDEAVAMANDTEFGLGAYLHTSDVTRALRVAANLDSGSVGINGGFAPAHHAAPFGGVKQSGYGRQGGRHGLMEFVRVKNVMIDLSTG